ncbi:MAG: DUF805 domain-containing protein [Balneolales bacterium]|nr:DUF805 domain-containing protein [Balneolales bacterium]
MINSEKHFFSTKGRINRRTYAPRIFTIAVVFSAFMAHLALTDIYGYLVIILALGGIAQAIIAIQTVKRMHDFGNEGFSAIWVLLPVVGLILALAVSFKKGDVRANTYGAVPMGTKIYASTVDAS